MNIIVCIKQVPDTTEIRIDPVKHTLIRAGVPSILNPFDGYALEAAARLKDKNPDTNIYVLSMGPNQAMAVLREAMSMAADKAYLVSGRSFGGSDTLATSYIISQAIKKIERQEGIKFDAIFCGKQAIDGDTAQVGPEIAEHLGLPQVTYGLECEKTDTGKLLVLQEGDGYKAKVVVDFPCLVTFTKPNFDPRFPTVKRKLAAKKAEIKIITDSEEDFPDMDRAKIGLKGSPTRVKTTFTPEPKQGGIVYQKEAPEVMVKKLVGEMHKSGLI